MKWLNLIRLTFLVTLSIVSLIQPSAEEKKPLRILATTFPIYLFAQNVTHNVEQVEVSLLLPAQLGCPHDYALTPHDMRKLSQADVLIVNGLGLEEFIGAPVVKANSHIRVIDSSSGITDTLESSDIHFGEEHQHSINPHLFASPRMAAKIAQNIAKEIAKILPAAANNINTNADRYAAKLNALADQFSLSGNTFLNRNILQPHGVFDYLARDAGLKIAATVQAHGKNPSAAEMRQLLSVIKKKKIAALFTEPQYPEKVGKTLARETGIALATLDPVANGPEDAPLDHYETVMRKNLQVLEQTLGRKK